MRLSIFLLGLLLFIIGTALLLSFTLLSNYIATFYPVSGYLGIGVILVGFALLYKGIFAKPRYIEVKLTDVEEGGEEEYSFYS
ncbi:MAG TPA: hypothetical protein ENF43_00010 [Thermoplasmatales archaeon]|nr:hypothetical protein [Thermoplasmatales archaeon]